MTASGGDQPEGEIVLPDDDCVISFRLEASGISGRLIRIGPTLDALLARHVYPDAVSATLAETLTLAGLLGSALPVDGNLSLQIKSDGALPFLIADCRAPGELRGYARVNEELLSASNDGAMLAGDGQLAITIDTGSTSTRYQSVIAIDDAPLKAVVGLYFEEREGLPTFLELAVARSLVSGSATRTSGWQWRAGALMLQNVSPGGSAAAEDDGWGRAQILAATIEPHELLDPTLPTRELLLRLFHEDGVRIERVVRLNAFCRCSRDKVQSVLTTFGAGELSDMTDADGGISVTCEFCSTIYAFTLSEIGSPSQDLKS